ncbi:MAG TPA: EpsI family protein [Methylophilaceae bacterium]|jgi:EpsI family protein
MNQPVIQQARPLNVFQHVPMLNWLVLLLAVLSLATATWLTPHDTWFNHIGKPDFEVVVPKEFGDWVDTGDGSGGMVVSPEQAAAVSSVYSQVVTRAYQYKPTGEVLMLSVGYGDEQLRSKQLHRPEACYSSQGFLIDQLASERIKVGNTEIGLFRMTGTMGNRTEQVTYWIRVGDEVISGPPTDLNIKRMTLGLHGFIADGLLFRVSTLDTDPSKAKKLQDKFISDLLMSVNKSQQIALIGQPLNL